jgi:glyoxalase superfamily protein
VGGIEITWVTILADVPAARLDAACAFWTAVTGSTVGEAEGGDGQYLPIRPADGDPALWIQRVGRPDGGWHFDFDVVDLDGAVAHAERAGAGLDRTEPGLAVLHTPGGQPFCLAVDGSGRPRRQPAPSRSPAGRSMLDQICFDIPADRFDGECAFWSALTGWPPIDRETSPEFRRIAVPERLPAQMLFQRLGLDDAGGFRAHADLSADDRAAEVDRHVTLGAEVVRTTPHWTTLRDPAGLVYCVTGRPTGVRST